jgi:hypothetical protein
MKPRSLSAMLLRAGVLLVMVVLNQAGSAAAQNQPGRVQRITGQVHAGETHAFLLKDLQAGDRLTVVMRSTSGDLDPAIGIMDTSTPLAEVMIRYRADVQRLLAENHNVTQALEDLRRRYFLAWDDDSGDGYAAALEHVVPATGDYVLIAASSLSALGRATSGDYDLLIGLNAPAAQDGEAKPSGPPIAEQVPNPWGLSASVEEASGTLTAGVPKASLPLVDIDAGEMLTAYVEATSGNPSKPRTWAASSRRRRFRSQWRRAPSTIRLTSRPVRCRTGP